MEVTIPVSDTSSFASTREALSMLHAVMGYLSADAGEMATEAQAECLLALEQLNAVKTATRARVLGAFNAGQGYCRGRGLQPEGPGSSTGPGSRKARPLPIWPGSAAPPGSALGGPARRAHRANTPGAYLIGYLIRRHQTISRRLVLAAIDHLACHRPAMTTGDGMREIAVMVC